MLEVAIKWSGSKRSQSEEIIKYFPKKIGVYYEPFCGGASMLNKLLHSDIEVERYVCSDINSDLIGLWNKIKENPNEVSEHYAKLWHEMNDKDDNKERKKKYFESVRERLNKEHNPLDFMFIMRTTTNGMPRYNKEGNFNNSFHVTRNGIKPEQLRKVIESWSKILKEKKVEFRVEDYRNIKPKSEDFCYLDPPYANTKGMYYGGIDCEELWKWLRGLECKWLLSYDGISGTEVNTYNVPTDLYKEHKYIKSGNSSFKRVIGTSKDSIVYESLYISK